MVQAGIEMNASGAATNTLSTGQTGDNQPDAKLIGREFVRQYYTMLAENPRYVHRFYSQDSIFIHGDSENIVGQAVKKKKPTKGSA